MYRTRTLPSFLHKIRGLPALLLALSIVSTLVLTSVGIAHADGIPGGNIADPVVRAVDIAKPAVVRIITDTSGRLTVNFSPTNSVTFPQIGTTPYQTELSGSGTFISANGDILTADHVVTPPDEVLQEVAAKDVSTYVNAHPEVGLGQTTPDQITQLLKSGQLKSTALYDMKRSEVLLSTDYTGPLSATDMSLVPDSIHAPVDRIEKESSFAQKDVAIIHTPFTDTPSVLLADSSTVQTQDQLTIIGFPGNGDVSNRPTDLLTSSVNTISVSSIKTTDNGAPVIQVGGNVEQGDSGGPALNREGDVVGVVSFGSALTAGSTSFLQASNSARDLIQSLNLNTKPGKFENMWTQAFNDYAATTPGHWHKAAQEFKQLTTTYPSFKAVSKYLDYAQTQAKTEKVGNTTPTTTPSTGGKPAQNSTLALAITIASIVVLVLLVLVLFGVAVRQRKKKTATGSTAAPVKPAPRNAPVSNAPLTKARIANTPPPNAPIGQDDGMTAFGAPPKQPPLPGTLPTSSPARPAQGVQSTPLPQSTATLRPWPCGHMNRTNARFCSICGEPAPDPPTIIRRVEQ